MLKEILKNCLAKTILLLPLFIFSCQNRIAIDNIDTPPPVTGADEALANVYQLLDGTWEGTFEIYEDSQPKKVELVELYKLTRAALQKDGLKLSNSIKVKQVYTSESPYFQRVQITDTYPESGKVEHSRGVNKVQDGKMWCVVKKPNDTVIHEGHTEGKNTIIWQSDNSEKKEYFYETVDEKYYEIIGWGYYGSNEDRSLSPKLWFYGRYQRK